MYFHICPRCGSHLDPGERCDCETQRQKAENGYIKKIREEPDGQLRFDISKRQNAQLI